MNKNKNERPMVAIKGSGKRISLKHNAKMRKHPQGRKISSDLYRALSIIAKYFAKDFVKDLPESKKDDVYTVYVEKFIRHFKELDFLNISVEEGEYFNKKFSNDIIYRAIIDN